MYVNIYQVHGIKGLDNPYWYQGSFTTDVLPNVGEMFDDEDVTYKIIGKKYKTSKQALSCNTLECDLIVKKMK